MKYYINIYLHHGFTNNRQHSVLGPMSWQPLFLLSTVVSQWWMAPRVAQSSVRRGPMLRSWRRMAKASLFYWQPRTTACAPRHRLVLAWGGLRGRGFLNKSFEPKYCSIWQFKEMSFNPKTTSRDVMVRQSDERVFVLFLQIKASVNNCLWKL